MPSFWPYLSSRDPVDVFSLVLVGNRVMRREKASVEWLRVGRLKAGAGEIFLGAMGTLVIGELVVEGAGDSMVGVCGGDGGIICAKGRCWLSRGCSIGVFLADG